MGGHPSCPLDTPPLLGAAKSKDPYISLFGLFEVSFPLLCFDQERKPQKQPVEMGPLETERMFQDVDGQHPAPGMA